MKNGLNTVFNTLKEIPTYDFLVELEKHKNGPISYAIIKGREMKQTTQEFKAYLEAYLETAIFNKYKDYINHTNSIMTENIKIDDLGVYVSIAFSKEKNDIVLNIVNIKFDDNTTKQFQLETEVYIIYCVSHLARYFNFVVTFRNIFSEYSKKYLLSLRYNSNGDKVLPIYKNRFNIHTNHIKEFEELHDTDPKDFE